MTGTWFDTAGLGMFIHWDHASQQGLEISWPLVGGGGILVHAQNVTPEQYHSSAATFDPQAWDAPALARRAKAAGVQYAVLTTKHHNGFSMWPTKLDDWHIGNTPYGKDIVREFADAMRAEGIRVGFYYSLCDWHHPDYPAFTMEHRPYQLGTSPPMPSDEQWDRFLEFMYGQITELLTDYGDIAVIWFDGGWERRASQWRSSELEQLIRSLQPEILINDRLPRVGDYETPEQFVPPTPPERKWETCMTMNESWSWNPADTDYKSPRSLVHTLCEVVGRGGNLLLNVSPMGDGSLPPEQEERLDHVARWVEKHREAVIGVESGLEAWQHYGPSTRRGNRTYVHLLARPYESVTVRGVKVRQIERITELASGTELEFSTRTGIMEGFLPDPDGEVTITVPGSLVDDDATVLAIDFRA
ncbi:MAG TPA: alpha-L-fucosidase [Acidimicrobiales bacterium]|nr:alpha-L-fucosidase [Acidimicrobiales bacterium]